MKTLGRNLGLALITCAAVLFAGAPAKAATTTGHDTPSDVGASQSPQGVKGRTAAQATILVAKAIRKGTTHFATIVRKVDTDAVAPFMKHSGKIADVLDDIAKVPDLVVDVIRSRLFHLLSDPHGAFKIKHGLAMDIADVIAGVIKGLM